ncbi:Melanopsin [Trichoplax sp. H2]|nr:Melanopsin [Trichoplax sp. H2]|eukprot:RDD36367.1 Melanopsin [Trichoplax sp. H2]
MRYIKVVKSFSFQRYFSGRNMVIIIFLIWFLPLLLILPPLIGFWGKLVYSRLYGGTCILLLQPPIDSDRLTYNILIVGMAFFLTNTVTFWCYYQIYRATRNSSHRIHASTSQDHPVNTDKSTSYTISSIRQRNEGKYTRTLFIIYLGYFISYWPIALSSSLSLLGLIKQELMWMLILTTIMYSNSILNPWIILLSQRYRRFITNQFFIKLFNSRTGEQGSRSDAT